MDRQGTEGPSLEGAARPPVVLATSFEAGPVPRAPQGSCIACVSLVVTVSVRVSHTGNTCPVYRCPLSLFRSSGLTLEGLFWLTDAVLGTTLVKNAIVIFFLWNRAVSNHSNKGPSLEGQRARRAVTLASSGWDSYFDMTSVLDRQWAHVLAQSRCGSSPTGRRSVLLLLLMFTCASREPRDIGPEPSESVP